MLIIKNLNLISVQSRPLRNLLTSICNFVPCDRVVQRAFCTVKLSAKAETKFQRSEHALLFLRI